MEIVLDFLIHTDPYANRPHTTNANQFVHADYRKDSAKWLLFTSIFIFLLKTITSVRCARDT